MRSNCWSHALQAAINIEALEKVGDLLDRTITLTK